MKQMSAVRKDFNVLPKLITPFPYLESFNKLFACSPTKGRTCHHAHCSPSLLTWKPHQGHPSGIANIIRKGRDFLPQIIMQLLPLEPHLQHKSQ